MPRQKKPQRAWGCSHDKSRLFGRIDEKAAGDMCRRFEASGYCPDKCPGPVKYKRED